VFDAICCVPRQGGHLTLLLSITARDGRAPLSAEDITRVLRAYHASGFALIERRAIARDDVEAAHSSWGKRLDVGGIRSGLLVRFERNETSS
jgi:hypothetical protein